MGGNAGHPCLHRRKQQKSACCSKSLFYPQAMTANLSPRKQSRQFRLRPSFGAFSVGEASFLILTLFILQGGHLLSLDFLSPTGLVNSALRVAPAFRYAVGAAGLIALVAIVSKFGLSPVALLSGVTALFTVMVLFLLFSRAAAVRNPHLALPALVLVWFSLLAGMLASAFASTSAFFNWPLPLRSVLVRSLAIDEVAGPEQFTGTYRGTVNTRVGNTSFQHAVTVTLRVSGEVVSGDYENDAGDQGLLSGRLEANNLKLKFISGKIVGTCDLNGSISAKRDEISAVYRCSDDEHAAVELKRSNAKAR